MQDKTLSKNYINSKFFKTKAMSNIVDLLMHFTHLLRNFVFALIIIIAFVISIVLVDKGINAFRTEKLPALIDTYQIVSPSMTPTIKVDETVMVRRVDYKNLKKGDIITFKSSDPRLNGMVITHRINEVVKDKNGNVSFITKGDNNQFVDEAKVLPSNIYGKVVVKIPFFATIKNMFSNPIFIAVVILILFGLIVSRNKKKYTDKEEEVELLSFDEENIEII